MPLIQRTIMPLLERSGKSILLLGPRQTGKSTLVRGLKPDLSINLAHEPTYLEFARNPRELEERLEGGNCRTVFLDEVQRLPGILNTVQVLLDEGPQPLKFYLTGSSARQLKRGHANLLPGRVHTFALGSLTRAELGDALSIKEALSTGTLPGIWMENDPAEKQKTLRSYAATYLREEIQAEALTRNIEGFSRFLFVVAAEAGKFLDLSKLASDASIPRETAVRYFEILEETLIIRRSESFWKSDRRRLTRSPRFFFFDTGVLNGLLQNFVVSPDRIGALFEHFLFNQLVDGAAAKDIPLRISSYRTGHGAEVDFIVELNKEVVAIEAKASFNVGKSDLRGFKSFTQYYGKKHRSCLVTLGRHRKVTEGIDVLPWQEFLRDIGL
ncbi:MAG: ATP-binding protein [Patescibacteria group bacterium]